MQRNFDVIAARLKNDGPLLTIDKAARLIPTGRGRRTHVSKQALVRWIVHGRHGVFLDGIKGSTSWLTTEAAVMRFLAASSEVAARAPVVPATESDMQRRARAAMDRIRARG